MRRNLYIVDSETYELKIIASEHGKPLEFQQITKNFKRTVDKTGTTTEAININCLRTQLHGGKIREFDKLDSKNSGTKNSHLKFI